MAARAAKRGAGRKKKAEGGDDAAQLSRALQTLAATRAELNRAELRAVRAEDALKASQKTVADQTKRAEAAEIMARRTREEQAVALREQLKRYEERLGELSSTATEGHQAALKLHEERAALLERIAATEAQRDNMKDMADAERRLREKLEELQAQASERLEGFIEKSKPLIDENKRLAEANAALTRRAAELEASVKRAADRQADSLKLLGDSRDAIHKLEQARIKDAAARRELLKRVEKAETMAADALRESVKDKKELTRLLKRDRQATKLASLLQARVDDLERRAAASSEAQAAGAAAPGDGGAAAGGADAPSAIAEGAAAVAEAAPVADDAGAGAGAEAGDVEASAKPASAP